MSSLGLSGCCGAPVINEGHVMLSELCYGRCSKCGLSGIYDPLSVHLKLILAQHTELDEEE